MFDSAMNGLALLLGVIWVVPIGVVAGMIFGAIPGLNASGMLAILLPVMLTMPPEVGLVFAVSLYAGGETANAFPAIMLNIPGDASAAVSAVEGFPMMLRGEGGKALGMCVMGSSIGALLGGIMSLTMAPLLGMAALKFSSVEICIVILFGLTAIAQISSGGLAKGLMLGFLGMLVGTTGTDAWGAYRGTFGSVYLFDGIPTVAALIGLLGYSEILVMLEQGVQKPRSRVEAKIGLASVLEGFREALRYPVVLLRSSLTGMIVGIIPGAGGSIASFLSYQQAISFASPEARAMFGKGSPEGLLAGDTANNTCVGGAIVPLLTLGIPGSSAMTVLLVLMAYNNLEIGPRLFAVNGDIAYSVLWSQFFAAACLLFVGGGFALFASRLALIPVNTFLPILGVACLIGGFAQNQYLFDLGIMILFGVLGFIMKKQGYPLIVLLLGMILGPVFERHLLRGLSMGFGSPEIFFTRPIALALWAVLLLTLFGPVIWQFLRRRKAA